MVRGQFSSGVIIFGGNCPGGYHPGGNDPEGNYPGDNFPRGQDNCPRTYSDALI